MNFDKSIDNLPLELLLMIFKKLRHQDLKSAMLVSKKWKSEIEHPSMWKHFIAKAVYPEHVGRLLNIPRLCRMTSLVVKHDKECIEIQGVDEAEGVAKFKVLQVRRVEDENVNEIQEEKGGTWRKISDLDISTCDMIKVNPDRLGDFLNNMKRLKLFATQFTCEQLEDIFRKMSEFTNLEKLDIHLKSVDSTKLMDYELIGNGLNKIRTLNIHEMNKQFMLGQTEHFFQKMSEETDIQSLTINNANLPYIAEDVLAKALNNIENLKLSAVAFTRDQAKEFFSKMKDFTNLKYLEIDSKQTNINTVNPISISKGLSKLTKVTLNFTYLASDQLEYLIKAIARKSSLLKDLNLWSNDLSEVPNDVLAEAVNKLKIVNLKNTKLKHEQTAAIFNKMANTVTELVELDIGENDLSEIEPELLAKAVNKVKLVNISLCSLNSKQVEAVFEQALVETRTTFLDVENNSTGEISAELITKVDKKLKVQFLRTKKQKSPKQICTRCGKGPFVRLRLHKCRN